MLNVKVIEEKTTEKPKEYTGLMISQEGSIVLCAPNKGECEKSFSGVILNPTNTWYESIYFSNKWIKNAFKPFEGSVTLSNKTDEDEDESDD